MASWIFFAMRVFSSSRACLKVLSSCIIFVSSRRHNIALFFQHGQASEYLPCCLGVGECAMVPRFDSEVAAGMGKLLTTVSIAGGGGLMKVGGILVHQAMRLHRWK